VNDFEFTEGIRVSVDFRLCERIFPDIPAGSCLWGQTLIRSEYDV